VEPVFRLLVKTAKTDRQRVLPREYDAKRARRAAIYAALYEPAPVVVCLKHGADVERFTRD
jgi:hypothetical protein